MSLVSDILPVLVSGDTLTTEERGIIAALLSRLPTPDEIAKARNLAIKCDYAAMLASLSISPHRDLFDGIFKEAAKHLRLLAGDRPL
jgi:hypothetical protein